MTIAGDKVRVEALVRVPIGDAFAVFTTEIDRWWRRGPAYRIGGKHVGPLHLEPELGGRIFQQYGAGGAAVHEIGRITVWEPPHRFAFTWRGINFRPTDAATVVEVWFAATASGTRVTLEHRGFAALPDDHPVRHGKPVAAFVRDLGLWWGGLLTGLRELAEPEAEPGPDQRGQQ